MLTLRARDPCWREGLPGFGTGPYGTSGESEGMNITCPDCQQNYEVNQQKPRSDKPPGVREENRGGQLRLSFWVHGFAVDLSWLGLLLGFFVCLCAMSFSPRPTQLAQGDVGAWLWFSVDLGLLFWIGRGLFRTFLVRPTLELDSMTLRAFYAPLGSPRVEIPVRQLTQLYVTPSGELRAQAGLGEHQLLLCGRPDLLRYIEQAVEERLQLEDTEVTGEWRPSNWILAEWRTCPHCGFELPVAEITRQLEPVSCPASVQADRQPESLSLRWDWRGPQVAFLTLWLLFWDSVCLGVAGTGLSSVLHGDLRGLGVLLIPHIWIGVGMTYYYVALLLNHTVIRCENGFLRISSGPLPWWNSERQWRMEDVEQLYVVTVRGSKSVNHYLEARMTAGDRVRLLGSTPRDRLVYIEQELERFLGIVNEG